LHTKNILPGNLNGQATFAVFAAYD